MSDVAGHLDLPGGRRLVLDRPRIVGVLNVTPDSFSDGGDFANPKSAAAQAQRMFEQGADAIDVGGESTRPGAARVDAREQIRRVLPVIERLAQDSSPAISIDTTLAAVAEAALDAGASIINDVSAGRDDPDMFALAADRGAPIVLMHMLGQPATMQRDPKYDNVVAEVRRFLVERAEAAIAAGVRAHQIVIDPGIGFGKTIEHNLRLLSRLHELVELGFAVMLGASRKSFIGAITGLSEPKDRIDGTIATTVIGVMSGVRLFRVHDAAPNRRAADVTFAIARHQTDRLGGSAP